MNQSVCVGGTVNFTCVVIFTSGTLNDAAWITNYNFARGLPGYTETDDRDGRAVPANVTNVLTITNVSISGNGADYVCVQIFNIVMSNAVFLTVFGKLQNCSYIHGNILVLVVYPKQYTCIA